MNKTDRDMLHEFVIQSNGIEGYTGEEFGPGSLHYDNHLKAAEMALSDRVWQPRELHFVLMHGLLPIGQVGTYRTEDVWVGGNSAVSPGVHLLNHMERWEQMVVEGPSDTPISWTWNIHHEFECVHPFIDGNGRTGRLVLNALRVMNGLPWLTINVGGEQEAYYQLIRSYRKNSFVCSQVRNKPWYKGVRSE